MFIYNFIHIVTHEPNICKFMFCKRYREEAVVAFVSFISNSDS